MTIGPRIRPQDARELADFILANADSIYVRACVDGKWVTRALTDLPASTALQHALGFIIECRRPVVSV